MTGDLALSVDELRAVARAGGLLLPSLLLDDDDLDAGVRDAVAVRGLLARGLVRLSGEGVALTASLAEQLRPLTAPCAVAELEREAAGVNLRTAAAHGPDGLILLSEREPDVWLLSRRDTDLAGALLPLLDESAADGGGSLAVARRDGTTYVLQETSWVAGEQPTVVAGALLDPQVAA